jgi:hypothetical protein
MHVTRTRLALPTLGLGFPYISSFLAFAQTDASIGHT